MKGIEPNWLPYVRIANVGRTVERAREQGGSVLLQRKDLAILIDPTAAAGSMGPTSIPPWRCRCPSLPWTWAGLISEASRPPPGRGRIS
jgi:hypothetical protein